MPRPSKTFLILLAAIFGLTVAGFRLIPDWIKTRHATATADEIYAMTRIAQADRFCFGGTGYAATQAPTDIMFEYVLFSPKAADLFAWAFEHGTPQGQMFALLGLRHLDPQRCRSLAGRLSPSAEVDIASGCTFYQLSSKEAFLHEIESGSHDGVVLKMIRDWESL